jgi:hypothetical protein
MDIVDRLQDWSEKLNARGNTFLSEIRQKEVAKLCLDAIDEIQKLRRLEERIEDLTRTIKANIEHANDLIKKHATPC